MTTKTVKNSQIQELVSKHLPLIKQLPNRVTIKNIDSQYIYASDEGTDLVGYKRGCDLIGLSFENLKCPMAEYADVLHTQNNKFIKAICSKEYIAIGKYINNLIRTERVIKKSIVNAKKEVIGIYTFMSPFKLSNNLQNLLYTNKIKIDIPNFEVVSTLQEENLTKRETECLFFFLRGKTANEIAIILHRSLRTIQTHLENLKSKMHCDTKSQLFEYAIEKGYLYIAPELLFHKIE